MINKELLGQTVEKLLAQGKGILAADESNGTADKRLESVGAETGEEMRKKYRDLFLCMPGLEKYVSGVILYDETFWQDDCAGENFAESLTERGVVPGIKVDTGAKDNSDFPGEKITEGLETLDERLPKYFTKRIIFRIISSRSLSARFDFKNQHGYFRGQKPTRIYNKRSGRQYCKSSKRSCSSERWWNRLSIRWSDCS
jgi:fructose-bisphosphate aldolase class 1